MISDPSPGDSVFVIQITGKLTAAVITDLKPIEGLSCVSGKFSDADKEALIPLGVCYTTESEALGYASRTPNSFLIPFATDSMKFTPKKSMPGNKQPLKCSPVTEEDLSSIKDLSIDDVHNSLIQRRPDIAPGQIRMLNGSDVYLQLQSRIYRTKSLLHNRF